MFSLTKSECLTQPIQMQLSRYRKTFSQFFSSFPKSTSNFEHFPKKDEPRRLFVSEILACKRQDYLNASKDMYQNIYGQSIC